ncbi:VTC2 Vacuolar transporter chaperone 2 [Candida maltosa Xu316]
MFGQKLNSLMYQPWSDFYLNYNNLKKLLKEGVILENSWTETDEQNFVTALDENLEKVYKFAENKYHELNEKLDDLQVTTLATSQNFDENKFSKQLDDVLLETEQLGKFQRLNFTGFLKIDNHNVKDSYTERQLSSFKESNTEFSSFKFWIKEDDVNELQLMILRKLPLIVYNNRQNDDDDEDDDEDEDANDVNVNETVTCVYFDNDQFDIYNSKLEKIEDSTTLRVRFVGKLSQKPKITMELKHFDTNGAFNDNVKIQLKKKSLKKFVQSKKVDEKLLKLNDESSVNKLSEFINTNNLHPVIKVSYTRSAFELPGENDVRITIDSNIKFSRDETLELSKSGSDAKKFPFSTMEIKVKKGTKKNLNWVSDLINSSLVKEVPNFSKYIQGIATLFSEDERVNLLPLWEADFVSNTPPLPPAPPKANDDGITSLTASANFQNFKKMLDQAGSAEIEAIPEEEEEDAGRQTQPSVPATTDDQSSDDDDYDEDDDDVQQPRGNPLLAIWNFPKLADADSEAEEVELPAGVTEPQVWLKNLGPIKIEPKVWLANERTFNRWLHVTTLLSSLTFIIYSSTKDSNFEGLSTYLAYFYFALIIFSGLWAYYVFMQRRNIILERSDKPMDNSIGPLIVAFGLIVALTVNFVFGWKKIDLATHEEFYNNNPMHKKVHEFVVNMVN